GTNPGASREGYPPAVTAAEPKLFGPTEEQATRWWRGNWPDGQKLVGRPSGAPSLSARRSCPLPLTRSSTSPRACRTECLRADVEADVREVVDVLARDQPDDVADLPLRVVSLQSLERLGRHLLVLRQLGRVVERRALGLREEWARLVLGERVEASRVAEFP